MASLARVAREPSIPLAMNTAIDLVVAWDKLVDICLQVRMGNV